MDFKKKLKHLYQPSAREVSVVDVPPMNFLMIDGQGDPNGSEAYADAVAALFSVSYTLKFRVKSSELRVDYGVMPLEGLWWADDMAQFSVHNRTDWQWTMMMMQPEFILSEMVAEAVSETHKKKPELDTVPKLRFERFAEGEAAQLLHLGPFSEEGPTVEKLHAYVNASGTLSGKHHEIYLSDITRAAAANWKTVIRQPFRPTAATHGER